MSLSQDCIVLAEYKQYKDLKFEIQIRTMLQHTWAEIEHGINYKSNSIIPEQFQRQIYLLSALLEVGDNNFQQLNDQFEQYSKNIYERIKRRSKY